MGIREETERKVFSYIEEHHMIVSGDKIVAGVSGGADSLCLLFLLLEYAGKVPLSLSVAHIDHGIRPDAGEDARYVEELCRREGLSFYLTNGDAAGLAKREKISVEDAGRRIRYEAFRRAAEVTGSNKIAVAHNRNDNAETMLFHLFRGSGLKGLCGIAPVRGDIIRPVLCLERSEVEAYLRERGIPWRSDSTNEEDDYSRNRIRHHILSYAEAEVFPGTVKHMGRTAEMLEETEDYLEQQTREALNKCFVVPGERLPGPEAGFGGSMDSPESGQRFALDAEAFQSCHPALRRRMLHTLIKQLSPTGKDIHQIHIRDALSLFEREGNRSISLPFGITARRQYDMVLLERENAAERGTADFSRAGAEGPQQAYCQEKGREPADGNTPAWQDQPLKVPPWEEISGHELVYNLGKAGKLEFSAFTGKKWTEVPKNQYTKWFDYDKIEESLVIRSRCTGDYLTIRSGDGNIAHKSLKDYMVTEKIPRQQRDEIPVLAAGKHILWLTGWRISEYFKVEGSTRRILQVRLLHKEGSESCINSETEEKNVRTHQGTFTGGRTECQDSGDRAADQ